MKYHFKGGDRKDFGKAKDRTGWCKEVVITMIFILIVKIWN